MASLSSENSLIRAGPKRSWPMTSHPLLTNSWPADMRYKLLTSSSRTVHQHIWRAGSILTINNQVVNDREYSMVNDGTLMMAHQKPIAMWAYGCFLNQGPNN